MTTTTTLTERYISATIRSLAPEAQARRARRARGVDRRRDRRAGSSRGRPAEAAERAVLTELGDPGVLAAGYADRPLHLIGPRYFLVWWRLLKLLLWIVPACASVGVVARAGCSTAHRSATIIGTAVVVVIQVDRAPRVLDDARVRHPRAQPAPTPACIVERRPAARADAERRGRGGC